MLQIPSKEELDLKLNKCLSQLNNVPTFTAKNLVVKDSLVTLAKIEESLNFIITDTQPVGNKLTFVYSKTTGDAINLATVTYFYFKRAFDDYSPDHMDKLTDKIESLLYACHAMYNIAPRKEKEGLGSPQTDILLLFATSIIYRLGPYVLPRFQKVDPHETFEYKLMNNGTVKGIPVRSTYNRGRKSFKKRMKMIEFDLGPKEQEDGIAFSTGERLVAKSQDRAYARIVSLGKKAKLYRESMFESYFKATGVTLLEISKDKEALLDFDLDMIYISNILQSICVEKKLPVHDLQYEKVAFEDIEPLDPRAEKEEETE